jgi:predicted nucleotide-binding protein (sugar kinase/HSP70/actin superfamily)
MGVKPYIVNGSMNLNIPDRVDNSGNVLYSNKTIDLNNQIEKFYQLNYSADLGYNAKFKINTQFDHNGNNTANVALEMPF